jgi:hypothetical protein
MLHFKSNNADGTLFSINILEFVTVIINYCAVLHVIKITPITDNPHPILLNITDNISALNWTIHTCKLSKLSRLLARFFCPLLINLPLGINSQWISIDKNVIADGFSQIRKGSATNSFPTFDYNTLKQRYPELKHYSFFQIQPELISLIWDIVLTEKCPSHKEV